MSIPNLRHHERRLGQPPTISPSKPIKPATTAPFLAPPQADQISPDSWTLMPATHNGPNLRTSLIQRVRIATPAEDMAKQDDGQFECHTRLASQHDTTSQLQQIDSTPDDVPALQGVGGRQGRRMRFVLDSGAEISRPRRRTRQNLSGPARIAAKIQHSGTSLRTSQPVEPKKALLACPFYKADPNTYRSCRRFQLSRVKDVKQHILRKHSLPSYCHRCFEVFGDARSLGEHCQSDRPCERRDGPGPDGVSNEKWEKLNQQYQSRGKPIEDQWMDVWTTLFPEKELPKSIYVDSHVDETLTRLRVFWKDKRADIIEKTIGKDGNIDKNDTSRSFGLLDSLVNGFLRLFEAEEVGPRLIGASPSGTTSKSPHSDNFARNGSLRPMAGDPVLDVDHEGFSLSFDSGLGPEDETLSHWHWQPYLEPSFCGFSADARVDSSSNFDLGSEQSQYDPVMEHGGQRFQQSTRNQLTPDMCAPTIHPMLEDHSILQDSWMGPSSEPWPEY